MMVVISGADPEENSIVLYRFSDGYPESVLEQIEKVVKKLGRAPAWRELVKLLEVDGWEVGSPEYADDVIIDYFYVAIILREKSMISM